MLATVTIKCRLVTWHSTFPTDMKKATTECRATFLGLSLKWLCGSSVKENNLKSYLETVNVRVYRTRKVYI